MFTYPLYYLDIHLELIQKNDITLSRSNERGEYYMAITITAQDIKQYWLDSDYSKLVKGNINDFCRMWANEEGIILPDDFSVTAHNSPLFTKINSEKHAVNLILDKFGYPIVETESLTMDKDCATTRAKQLFNQYGHGVIRANRYAGGGGTFIIQNPKSIPMMISTILSNSKGPIQPLYSPYYKANVEYGAFIINGNVELVIAKHVNTENGLHNLTLGAKASVVTDVTILNDIEVVCSGLAELFGIGFGRIDILATVQGLKIVELSVPNFKVFSLQDSYSMIAAKKLFLTYYNTFYKKI